MNDPLTLTQPERFVLTGCSGGGKSTLLAELERRGEQVVPEVGRALVREHMAQGSDLLPWANAPDFTLELARRTIAAYDDAPTGRVFFDRGLIDVIAHFDFLGEPIPLWLADASARVRYASPVFVVPPWPEIYEDEGERGKDFARAVAEYDALCAAYDRYGYNRTEIAPAPIIARADFVLSTSNESIDDDVVDGTIKAVDGHRKPDRGIDL